MFLSSKFTQVLTNSIVIEVLARRARQYYAIILTTTLNVFMARLCTVIRFNNFIIKVNAYDTEQSIPKQRALLESILKAIKNAATTKDTNSNPKSSHNIGHMTSMYL